MRGARADTPSGMMITVMEINCRAGQRPSQRSGPHRAKSPHHCLPQWQLSPTRDGQQGETRSKFRNWGEKTTGAAQTFNYRPRLINKQPRPRGNQITGYDKSENHREIRLIFDSHRFAYNTAETTSFSGRRLLLTRQPACLVTRVDTTGTRPRQSARRGRLPPLWPARQLDTL